MILYYQNHDKVTQYLIHMRFDLVKHDTSTLTSSLRCSSLAFGMVLEMEELLRREQQQYAAVHVDPR